MGDFVEIEVKFHLSSVDSTRDHILDMGAVSSGRFFETNICFENREETFRKQGILLRLRKDEKVWLTFKAPPDEQDKNFKIYRELEIEVDNFDTCYRILESLGFHPKQSYEKWRETFAFRKTKILVDTTPCGVFLEIEGEKPDILDITEKLKLDWGERILLNYLAIFDIIRREENLPFNDMTFDNFRTKQIDFNKYNPKFYAG